MKKFQFSLQKILDYKNQICDVLKSELAVLTHELSELELEKQRLIELFESTDKQLQERFVAGTVASDISTFKVYLNNIATKIREKQKNIENQQNLIVVKQREIISMNVEIASMDKLKERQKADYTALEAKAFEIEITEFITNSTK